MRRKSIIIWMNHWFSTGANIVQLLRKESNFKYRIICTTETKDSLLRTVCDERYIEPVLSGEDYIDFCVSFCKQHHVDVFIPYRNFELISKHIKAFTDIGVKVMVDDYEKIALVNSKSTAYQYAKENHLAIVPDYHVVTTPEGFLVAYNDLIVKYRQICMKFEEDKGGRSFRLIDNERKGFASLHKKQNTRMSLNSIMDALSEKKSFEPIIVMPYLPDDEISVDCLNANGKIMVPRIKSTSKLERIVYDDNVLETCKKLMDSIHLEWPCNIQFKYMNGIPYFLEINPRMSGGIHMSCLAANINIPNIAVNKLLGNDVKWNIEDKACIVSQMSQPIIYQ